MNIVDNFISEAFVHALGWTILHSLWQGALIALLLGVLLLFLQKHSAKSRYVLSSVGLVVLLLTVVSTFVFLYQSALHDSTVTVIVTTEQMLSELNQEQVTNSATTYQGFFTTAADYFNQHLPTIVVLWLLGIMIMSLRFLGGMAYLQRLKHTQHVPLSHHWQLYLQSIKAQLGVKRSIQLVESALVSVPIVIGYLKPMILLPIGAVNGLDHKQVEAILAHELAHIYRHDYLVNIVQSVIEMVLFYHPAVWWISGIIREERENSCDDIAIQLCGDSLNYAKALTNLEAMKLNVPKYSLAFIGKKNQLLNRITRLLGHEQPKKNFSEGWVAVCILVGCLFISTTFNAKPIVSSNDRNDTELELPLATFEAWETDRTPLATKEETTVTVTTMVEEETGVGKEDWMTKEIQVTTSAKPLETFEFVVANNNSFVNEFEFTGIHNRNDALYTPHPQFFTPNDTDVVDVKKMEEIVIIDGNSEIVIIGDNLSNEDLKIWVNTNKGKKAMTSEEMKAWVKANVKETTPEEWEAFRKSIKDKGMTSEEMKAWVEANVKETTPEEWEVFHKSIEGKGMTPEETKTYILEHTQNAWFDDDGLIQLRVSGESSSLWADAEGDKVIVWGNDGKLKIKSKSAKAKGIVVGGKGKVKTKEKRVVISGLATTEADDEITIFGNAKSSSVGLQFDDVKYDKIYDELLKDGLIESKNKVSISIRKNKKIKINGKEVPNNLRKKYIKLLGVK